MSLLNIKYLSTAEKRFLAVNTLILIDPPLLSSLPIRELMAELRSNHMFNCLESKNKTGRLIQLKIRNKLNFETENQEVLNLITQHTQNLDINNFEHYLSIIYLDSDSFDFSTQNCFIHLLKIVDKTISEKKQKVFFILEQILAKLDAIQGDFTGPDSGTFITNDELQSVLFKLSFERNVDFEFSDAGKESLELLYNLIHVLLKNKYKVINKDFNFEVIKNKEQSKARILGITNDDQLVFVN